MTSLLSQLGAVCDGCAGYNDPGVEACVGCGRALQVVAWARAGSQVAKAPARHLEVDTAPRNAARRAVEVLADLELAGRGPRDYDLAPQVVAVTRYGRPATDLEEFLVAYGDGRPPAEVASWAVALYELWVTAWAVANRRLDDDHRREAALRVARWRPDGHDHRPAPTSPAATATWTLR